MFRTSAGLLVLVALLDAAVAPAAERSETDLLGQYDLQPNQAHVKRKTLMLVTSESFGPADICFSYSTSGHPSFIKGTVKVKLRLDGPEGTEIKRLKRKDNKLAHYLEGCRRLPNGLAEDTLITATFKFSRYPKTVSDGLMVLRARVTEDIPQADGGGVP